MAKLILEMYSIVELEMILLGSLNLKIRKVTYRWNSLWGKSVKKGPNCVSCRVLCQWDRENDASNNKHITIED